MKTRTLGICLFLLMNVSFIKGQSLADKVDMWMGTYGAGHCVVGPQLPHGSVNPSPQTAYGGHAGYVPDQPIRGFGQLHVSGIGWGRYGQIFLSPQVGFNPGETDHDSPKQGEEATPYYYKVMLSRYDIQVEISPTHHCVAYRFTFPETDQGNILLDIAHNIPQHIVPEVKGLFHGGEINYNPEQQTLTGWGEYSGGFGSTDAYKVYFAMKTDTPLKEVKITDQGDKALYACLALNKNPGVVHLNVGISLKSIENASLFRSPIQ